MTRDESQAAHACALGGTMPENDYKIFFIANWNHAGTQKFISHQLHDDEETTLCGLKWSELKGDWQLVDVKKPNCVRCERSARMNTLKEYQWLANTLGKPVFLCSPQSSHLTINKADKGEAGANSEPA